MRSRASFKSHPIHPALIPFPFAFLYGALGFGLAGRLTGNASWWTTGRHLAIAGVIAALVAAIPGFIDYLYSVPPNSNGKSRATKHMLSNLSAVTLFAVAWLIGRTSGSAPESIELALEGLGAVFLTMGGWMGGTLVNRNQIGVDHRYAKAGKWSDERTEANEDGVIEGVNSESLEVNQMKLLRVGDRRIVLGRTEEGYVAFDDHCTHRGGSLADGAMICGRVQCPWHGSQFDVRSGAVRAGPAEEAIPVYRVEQHGSRVDIHLPKSAASHTPRKMSG
jgi:nitrite reductase/ring-hydroxylating ferredoxin subunit/uncharacterized membrane protein